MDAHVGPFSGPLHEVVLKGKGTNASQDVSTVLRTGHAAVVRIHLEKEIIHVRSRMGAPADHCHLARQWMGAAHAVNLLGVR